MDMLTLGLLGLDFLGKQDQAKKQNILDQTEAKWSGFKNYRPFESTARSTLADLAKAGAVGYRGYKLDAEANKPKTGQTDETLAANQLMKSADQGGQNGLTGDESQYAALLKFLQNNFQAR